MKFLQRSKTEYVLFFFIAVYIIYFSVFTLFRHWALVSSYFDLGIMHQAVFNTYESLKTGDLSRFLEHTNPHGGGDLVKRMAIHNDVLLAFLAPLYFIFNGPETLLILQSIVLGIGAYAAFQISEFVFAKNKGRDFISLVFAISYLLYFPMERSNIFDFHVVTFSTSFLLFMFYFWLKRKHWWSFLFLVLSLLTKEQLGLTTAFFGFYILIVDIFQVRLNHFKLQFESLRSIWKDNARKIDLIYALSVIVVSLVWVAVSMLIIIPLAAGGQHFAEAYYTYIKDDPSKITFYLFHKDSWTYMFFLLGPLGFLSLLSPLHLLIAAPEFGINLLSTNWNMRNVIFHYTAVLQPFIFISAIYGAKRLTDFIVWQSRRKDFLIGRYVAIFLLLTSVVISFFKSPLPYSKEADVYPFTVMLNPKSSEYTSFYLWKNMLKDPTLKISASGHLGAHLTSRRYFYNFSDDYIYADYVILQLDEVENGFQKDMMMPAYEKLKRDPSFSQVYKSGNLEVYKKNSDKMYSRAVK